MEWVNKWRWREYSPGKGAEKYRDDKMHLGLQVFDYDWEVELMRRHDFYTNSVKNWHDLGMSLKTACYTLHGV